MTVQIPQASPLASYTTRQTEIDAAVARVLQSGWYILGKEVEAFEREYAAWNSLRAVVGAASGTDAIELMLRALDIGTGDEVITSSHTATATVSAIEKVGALPVLVDIDFATYNLDPQQVAAVITPCTKAILPVHLYGFPADMTAFTVLAAEHRITLLEDCAQAHGARWHGQRVGTFGRMSSFSFYPTKNLGAFGDGGAVGIMDETLAERTHSIAQYGWRTRYIADEPGMNTRLDELQAAILRVKLRDLDADNARRRAVAARYTEALRDCVPVPPESPHAEPVFHLYVIRCERRDEFRKFMSERGIGTAVQYPAPIHLQPAYQGRLGDVGSFPNAERATREVVSLPLYPELSDAQADQVIEAVRAFFA